MTDISSMCSAFGEATENGKLYAIRSGAEPMDFHAYNKIGQALAGIMPDFLPDAIPNAIEGYYGAADDMFNNTFKGGLGAIGNHRYMELGVINDKGEFETLKRIHSFSVQADSEGNLKLSTEPTGRTFTLAVDGKNVPFNKDPIYQMDPHATKPYQLQSADDGFILDDVSFSAVPFVGEKLDEFWDENIGEDGATKIIVQGSERDMMDYWGGLLETAIHNNNNDNKFDAMGNGAPNGNSMHSKNENVVETMAHAKGIKPDDIGTHNPSGIDFGSKYDGLPEVPEPRLHEYVSLGEQREYIDSLEKTMATQWDEVLAMGENIMKDDLNVELPKPPGM